MTVAGVYMLLRKAEYKYNFSYEKWAPSRGPIP